MQILEYVPRCFLLNATYEALWQNEYTQNKTNIGMREYKHDKGIVSIMRNVCRFNQEPNIVKQTHKKKI